MSSLTITQQWSQYGTHLNFRMLDDRVGQISRDLPPGRYSVVTCYDHRRNRHTVHLVAEGCAEQQIPALRHGGVTYGQNYTLTPHVVEWDGHQLAPVENAPSNAGS